MSVSGGAQMGTRNVPFTPIARQNSVFSLTLDEFAHSLDNGKPFGSMNMDEFLKNVWTVEESQNISTPVNGTDESNPPQSSSSTGLVRQSSLTHAGSLQLSRTLSRKTVDEVWRDIHQAPAQVVKDQPSGLNYGEMTLEDFLVRAGVVREESDSGGPASSVAGNYATQYPAPLATQNPFHGSAALAQSAHQATIEAMAHNQHHIEWQNFQLNSSAMQQQQQLRQQQAQEAGIAGFGVAKRGPVVAIPATPSGSGLEGSPDGALGQVNGLSPAITTPDTPNRGRKRGPESMPEKVVERRQRRMIKNRESAARSRARKQAYTVELEAEVTGLKEENQRLKKELEENMKRRRQELLKKEVEEEPRSKIQRLERSTSW